MRINYKRPVYYIGLVLGETYELFVTLDNGCKFKSVVKLIKVTKKGYNFFDEKTNKCILKHHIYPNISYDNTLLTKILIFCLPTNLLIKR